MCKVKWDCQIKAYVYLKNIVRNIIFKAVLKVRKYVKNATLVICC